MQCTAQDLEACVSYIKKLLMDPDPGPLPEGLESVPEIREIIDYILGLREILRLFAQGDLSPNIRLRGVLAGSLKALQANLRHLTWQMEQIANGDLSQRTDFLAGFSESFNNMVEKLAENRDDLYSQEQTLLSLTDRLRQEMRQREAAFEALQESEVKFKFLAQHDPLTGILNRRSFFELAEIEIAHNWTEEHDCAIVMCDIDNFKHFNDTYGHQFGDLALQHMVSCAQSTLRTGDTMGRYGGEEFIFLFVCVNALQAFRTADRIRCAVMENPLSLGDINVELRVSMGLAMMQKTKKNSHFSIDKNLQETISRADAALYQAKRTGKNKVLIWTKDMEEDTSSP